jgi:hypothetical protein
MALPDSIPLFGADQTTLNPRPGKEISVGLNLI